MDKTKKMISVTQLNIEHQGCRVTTVEERTDGEVWLLTEEFDGYHVCGQIENLEPEMQKSIKRLLRNKKV